jgi:hypothetical protein
MNDIHVYSIQTYEKQILHHFIAKLWPMKFVMQEPLFLPSSHLLNQV